MKLIKAIKKRLKLLLNPDYRLLVEKRRELGRIGGIKSGEVRRKRALKKGIENDFLKLVPEATIISDLLKKIDVDIEPIDCLTLVSRFYAMLEKLSDKKEPKIGYIY